MIELTEEMRKAVREQRGSLIRLVDPVTQEAFVQRPRTPHFGETLHDAIGNRATDLTARPHRRTFTQSRLLQSCSRTDETGTGNSGEGFHCHIFADKDRAIGGINHNQRVDRG